MLTLVSILLSITMLAQEAYAQPGIGVDPEKDSLSMKDLQAYLSKIREKRPTVALVLSGGGAKGVSHIGVIEYLDSLQIPVDVVLGTSMGGLIGSLYSLGYTPEQMDSLVRSFDWDVALTDRIPRKYISYNTTKYKEKILLSFPFYYSKKTYANKLEQDIQYAGAEKKYKKMHFGANDNEAGEGQSSGQSAVRICVRAECEQYIQFIDSRLPGQYGLHGLADSVRLCGDRDGDSQA